MGTPKKSKNKKNTSKNTKPSKNIPVSKSKAITIVPSIEEIIPPLILASEETDFPLIVERLDNAKIKIKPRDKVHYVNGKEFEVEIKAYYSTNIVSQKLGESITKIAQGLAFAPNFSGYSYREDMVGDAILKMFSALKNKKFRLDSGFNPFSYFTTVAFHAFINRIKKEKKQHDALLQYREKVYTEQMTNVNEDGVAVWVYVEPNDDYNSLE